MRGRKDDLFYSFRSLKTRSDPSRVSVEYPRYSLNTFHSGQLELHCVRARCDLWNCSALCRVSHFATHTGELPADFRVLPLHGSFLCGTLQYKFCLLQPPQAPVFFPSSVRPPHFPRVQSSCSAVWKLPAGRKYQLQGSNDLFPFFQGSLSMFLVQCLNFFSCIYFYPVF